MPRRQGRPSKGGPPTSFATTHSFHSTDLRWEPRPDHDAGEVAAAYAQQRFVALIRERTSITGDIAEALGRPRGDRTVADVLAGRRAISMAMLLNLAMSLDIPPLAQMDTDDLRSLLPPEYQRWLGGWRPGDGRPRFLVPFLPDGNPAWERAALTLTRWIEREESTRTLRVANDRVVAHAVVIALADAGLPVDLVSDVPVQTADIDLLYEASPPVNVAVHYLPDDRSLTRDVLMRKVLHLCHVAQAAEGSAAAVLVAATRSLTRLEASVSGISAPEVGNSMRVRPSVMADRTAAAVDAVLPELTLTVLATARADNDYTTLICELHKGG